MESDNPKKLRLEYLDPADLAANPRNWRSHPQSQLAALSDVLQTVGWAGALLFNEATGRLIDGHARKELTKPGDKVPVLIGSWTDEEEKLILATLDPIAAMADADGHELAELLGDIETTSEAIQALLDDIMPKSGQEAAAPDDFAEYDESIETEHKCPKCGYEWSGKTK